MHRYNDGREEGFFQEDEDENQPPQEVEAIIAMQGDLLGTMELDLAEQSLNQQLLETAVKLARQDLFWYFRHPSTKMRRIERIYRRLTGLVRESLEEKEEE